MDDARRYQLILDRDARYDGRFITGVLTTGIYCLPSCTARKPKRENVRFFETETEALAAGLRACKRCRPDLHYRGVDIDAACFESLQQRIHAEPAAFRSLADLAREAGVARSKLVALCREHGHCTPAELLRRAQLRQAAHALQARHDAVADIGYAAGFASEAVFHRQFLAHYAMTPAAYRSLGHSTSFTLRLPDGYEPGITLAYLGRDADGPAERRDGARVTKALLLKGQPVRLQFDLQPDAAQITVLDLPRPDAASLRQAQHIALRCLGLTQPMPTLRGAWATLAAARPGLRLPLSATVWEALLWAIVGQQVNLSFAATLRRRVIELAGQPAGDGMIAHPDIAAVAALDPAELCARQFSRSKAAYLIGTAQYLRDADWDIETLEHGSAPQALQRLQALHGIGPWTAQYTLLRGVGFADCVPVGDAGLTAALQRQHQLPERPDAKQTQALMARYAPYRSLATAHLWAGLKDAQP
ncbi:DNA-3-methyladenine glycosylase 2 family protein [Chitinimonas sp. BJYL2]|uniref:DNA-3-methyladenine glycosylase 2 family protein n=1 Tax=Chitinimonas sp. BJYL2 TaxID=2976696 RepID=UPI0022B42550|nr:Ada metal-binding domain-containing protein [Chitinimonas sp. BJYL2]